MVFTGITVNCAFVQIRRGVYFGRDQGALAGETERPCIRALEFAMLRCLLKSTTMRPSSIFFLLHCGARPQNYDPDRSLVSLFCVIGVPLSLSCIAFHMESEKHAVSSPLLKLPGRDR